ncbi:uncharacterized protein LOC110465139 isoform X2 [Mizuhopecten yessoensis]|nr:uncharacterized protein LOC110465139 isoform X2 [Mizuhopecten yessoensis]
MYMAAICPTGLLAPMATFPFLSPSSNDVASPIATQNSSDNIVNTTNSFITEGNISKHNAILQSHIAQTEMPASNVYIAFSISAGLALLSTLPFVVIYFKTSKHDNKGRASEESNFIGNLSLSIKRLQLVNIGVFAMFYMSLNFTFSGYLTAFCVQQLRWTKTSGALLTSVLFLTMLFGRIVGAYLSHFFKPMKMLVLSSLLHAVALFGFAASGVVLSDTGIWISVCIIGTVLSLIWPSLLSWTNENLISVRGKMSAFLLLIGFVGALSSPLLFGYMMEEVSPIWFCFLNLGKAGVLIINVILMFVYLRLLRKSRTTAEQ